MRTAVLRFGLAIATIIATSCGDDVKGHIDGPNTDSPQAAQLALDNMAAHFGSVTLGTTSPAQTLTVTNTGPAASGPITTSLTGAGSTNFSVTSTCTTLAMGASCQLTVTFTPSAAGPLSASLAVTATPGGTVTASLDGTGVAGGALTISANTNTLGSVVVGTTGPTTATFTVTNTGTTTTGPLSVQPAGSNPGDFPESADLCAGQTLAAGATCTFVASFAPTARGARSASFDVTGSPGGTVSGAVSGTGLAQAQLVALQLLDFGSVVTGTTSSLTLSVTNTGDVPSGTVASTVSGDASYTITSDSCATHAVAAAASCSVIVKFAPTTVGTKSGQLVLAATPGGPVTAILAGIGISPDGLVIAPSSNVYVSTTVGQTSTAQTFTVTNNALTSSGAIATSLAGATPSQFTIGADTCKGNTLAPAATCTVAVSFTPMVGGPSSATLVVTSQSLGAVTAALSGIGLAPAALAIAPTAKDFGSVAIGAQSPTQAFVVTNTGGQPTGIPSATLAGAGAAQFAIASSDCTATLAPQATCTVQVRLAPSALGAATATLTVAATPGGNAVADLSGNGVDANGIVIVPSSFTFPVTAVGDSAPQATFTVHNLGTTATGAIAIATAGASAADFVSTNDCTTLAAGATCTITTTFTPGAIGARTATVTATASPGGSATLALAGTGRPRLEIIADNAASPTDPYDFGSRLAGVGSADVIITIRNNTSAAKPLTLAEVYGSPAQFATLDNTCGATIASAVPCTVRVRFSPTSVGTKTGSLTFSIGAGAVNQAVQNLTGAGSALNDHPPTDLALAPSSVPENKPSGTTVGTLTSTDPDANESFTYALVAGGGATDNASFTIAGATLVTAASFDFETKSSYSIRVRTTDTGFQTFEKILTITVTDANDAPTGLALSPLTTAENQAAGAVVGTFTPADQDAGDTFTYALVAGAGSTDNASFGISGTTLVTAASFDFETKASYSVRVQVTDAANATFQQALTIAITNVNEAPTAISLSSATIAENQPTGTVIGTLSTIDPDAGDTVTFSLVAGAGGADNGSFTIVGNSLRSADVFDFDTKSVYTIRVRATDAGGLTFEQVLAIAITNANDAPAAIALSNNAVDENQPSPTMVGMFSTTDADVGDTFTYTLVAGAGSTDNAQFAISGAVLNTAAMFDFETKASYSIRVRSTDQGGLFTEQQFTILVTDVLEGPGDIALSPNSVPENQPSGTVVGTLSSQNTMPGQTFTYSLVGGAGGDDNASFAVVGNTIVTQASFNFETKSGYTIRVRSTDNTAMMSEKPLAISITDVNEPPVVNTTPSTVTYTENGTITVDPSVTVSDPDGAALASAQFQSAAVQLTTGCQPAEDVLSLDPLLVPIGMSASYNASSCTLSVTLAGGTMPVSAATIMAALRAVKYTNSSENPDVTTRVATFTATDAGAPTSLASGSSRSIAIIAVNDAPVVTTTAPPVRTWTESPGVQLNLVSASDDASSIATFATAAPHGFVVGDEVSVSGFGAAGLGYNGSWMVASVPTPSSFTAKILAPSLPTITNAGKVTQIGVAVDSTIAVSDVDSATLASATAQITTNCDPANDALLLATTTGGIAKSFDAATCKLTLTGPATVAQFQTVLSRVYFTNGSHNPSTLARTVTFAVNDGAAVGPLDSAPATRDVKIVAINDPPVVTAGATLAYTENQAATAIDTTITITDADSTTLVGATVQITSNYVNGEDLLAIPVQPNITATFNAASGKLTLTGTGARPIAEFVTALVAVTYANASDAPSTSPRTVSWIVDDGGANNNLSAAATSTITIGATNDAPQVSVPNALSYTENDPFTAIDPNLVVADPDAPNPTTGNLTGATIVITNFLTGEDAIQIDITGTSITPTPSTVGTTRTIALSGTDTIAHYQQVMRGIFYRNLSENPTATARNVTFSVTDGTTSSNTLAGTTITVIPVNDAPVATADSYSILSSNTLTVAAPGVLGNDTDVDGPSSHAVLVAGMGPAEASSFTFNMDGSFTYKHNDAGPHSATDSFKYKANDGSLDSSIVTVTINISYNQPPVGVADGYPVAEGGTLTVAAPGVLGNDSDPESNPFTAVLGTGPAHASSFMLNANGSFSYVHDGSETTTDSFTYRPTDADPGTLTTVTITVSPVNDAPVNQVPGTQTFNEDATLTFSSANGNVVAISDSDAGTASMTVTLTVQGGAAVGKLHASSGTCPQFVHGRLPAPSPVPATFACVANNDTAAITLTGPIANINASLNGMTFTPALDVNGSQAISMVTSDNGATGSGGAQTDTDTINLSITPVNDAPAAVADTYGPLLSTATLTVNAATGVLANDTDVDTAHGSLTAVLVSGPSEAAAGFVLNSDGSFSYTHNNAMFPHTGMTTSTDSFTYKANDGALNSNIVTVTITISYNRPPVGNTDAYSVNEGATLTVSAGAGVLANDTDPDAGDTFTAVPVSGPSHASSFTLNSDGSFTYVHDGSETTSDSFTYRPRDNHNLDGSVATVNITVNPVNDPPVFTSSSTPSVAENTTAVIMVTATDADIPVQTVMYSLTGGADMAKFTLTGSALTFMVAPNFEVPTDADTNNVYVVQVTANDGNGGVTNQTINVTVTDANEAPTSVGPSTSSVDENLASGTVVVALSTNDPDAGKTETFAFTTGCGVAASADNSSFALPGGSNQLTTNSSFNFEVKSTYKICVTGTTQPGNLTAETALTVNVNDKNEAPAITSNGGGATAMIMVNENATAVTTVIGSDPDGADVGTNPQFSTLTYSITGGADAGKFSIVPGTGALTLSVPPNFESPTDMGGDNTYVVEVTVTDGGTPGLTASQTITVKVIDVNEPPVAVADNYTALANTTLVIGTVAGLPAYLVAHTGDLTTPSPNTAKVLANDTDPDTNSAFNMLVVMASSGASAQGGSFQTTADGSFAYTPKAGFTGADSFTYSLSDGMNTVTGTVNVAVQGPRVWYLQNNTTAPVNDGTSMNPFKTIDAVSAVANATGDIIYVLNGNGTNTGYTPSSSLVLKSNQKLLGQGVALDVTAANGVSVPGLISATTAPLVGQTAAGPAETVQIQNNVAGVTIRGLNLSGATNAIDATTTTTGSASATISNNTITSGTAEAIDLNDGGSGAFAFTISNNSISAGTTGIDARTVAGAGSMTLAINSNTITGGNGIIVNGAAGGSSTITSFADNVVLGSTTGSGIGITTTKFDANPGTTAYETVSGGTTTIGASGNGVGVSGMSLSGITGDLAFTSFGIYADNGSGLFIQGSGAVNIGAGTGTRVTVGTNVAAVTAVNGAAVSVSNATVDLQLATLSSASSTGNGVFLNQTFGTFSAGSTSTITNATAADFAISSGTATVTYNGTITDDLGSLVTVTSETGGTKTFAGAITDGDDGDGSGIALTSNSGATIKFTGGITLSTGANPAFSATGGGTVEVTGAANKITTTSGTALNVTNTTIGANGLTFKSISSNGAAKGIVLNTTGANAGLTVAGNGGVCDSGHTSASDCTGGTIQGASTRGIELTSTSAPTLHRMRVVGAGSTAVTCFDDVAGGSNTACNAAIFMSAVTNPVLDTIYLDGTGSNDSGIIGNAVSALTVTTLEIQNFTNNAKTVVDLQNLTGTSTFMGLNVHNNSTKHVVFVSNNTGSSTITFTAPAMTNNNGLGNPDALQVDSYGTANMTVSATSVSMNNTTGLPANSGNGVMFQANTGSTMNATLDGGTVLNTNGILMQSTGAATHFTYAVKNLTNVANHNLGSNGITVGTASGGTINGSVTNNVITAATCGGGCSGISIGSFGAGGVNQTHTVSVTGNNISGVDSSAIVATSGQGAMSTNLTIQNNTIHDPVPTQPGNVIDPAYAIDVIAGTQGGDAPCMAVNLGDMSAGHTVAGNKNSITGSWQSGGKPIEVVMFNSSVFKLLNYGGSTDAAAATYVSASNSGAADAFHIGTNQFTGGASCP